MRIAIIELIVFNNGALYSIEFYQRSGVLPPALTALVIIKNEQWPHCAFIIAATVNG